MKTTQIELNNIYVELLIQKAFADGFNPAASKLITKSINKIKNEIENQTTKGSEGVRHSRNRIRQIEN
jgi:hypothetical protein